MPFAQSSASHLVGASDIEAAGQHDVGAQEHKRMPRADMVIVFPYKTSATVHFGDENSDLKSLKAPSDQDKRTMELWKQKRGNIIQLLSDSGLILMLYYSRDRDEIFCKVAADEIHIRKVAEMKRHKLELKPDYYSAFAEYKNDFVGTREKGYGDRRVVSHLYKAHLDEVEEVDGKKLYPNPGAIFRTVDRILLIDYIITSGDHDCAGVDIGEALYSGNILHYYPLHESWKLKAMDDKWFACFAWGTEIDMVRNYFGERIALYFLFLSHFIKWLVFPSLLGTGLHLFSIFYGTPDNYLAFIMMTVMGGWSILFIHFWKRTVMFHTIKWGTLNMQELVEPTRPKFVGVSRIDPITGKIDRYYPWKERIWKVMRSYLVLSLSIFVLFIVMVLVFFLRRKVHNVAGGRVFFMVLNAIIVDLLNRVFTIVARRLTEYENHRTERDFQNHLLAKTVIFKFVNCYISLYYIAFFKGKASIMGEPLKCMNDDCMEDLGWQLGIFMIVRLTFQNFMEFAGPYFLIWYRGFMEGVQFRVSSGLFNISAGVNLPDLSSAERESKKEEYEVFEDMDEILILYGYSTLFVVACPWVPLVAWVSLLVEAYLDQKKLVLLHRRPMPIPASNNEPWDTAFDIFGLLAMITNALVMIFASNIFADHNHATKLVLFVLLEHVAISMRIGAHVLLPSTPHEVTMRQLQQRVKIHRHLNMGGEQDDYDIRKQAMMGSAAPAPNVYDRDQDEDLAD